MSTTATTATTTKKTADIGLNQSVVEGKFRYVSAGHTPEASPDKFHLPALSEFGDERVLPLHSVRPIPSVQDLPKASDHVQLDTHGFTAVHRPTVLHAPPFSPQSFKDPELLKKHLIPDTAEMLKQMTGCKTVTTEALLLRAALWTSTDSLAAHGGSGDDSDSGGLETGFPQFIGFNPLAGGASPASKIHLDYSPEGARTHVRRFHPDTSRSAADIIAAEDSLQAAGKSLKEHYKDSDGPRWALYSIWRPLKPVKRDPLAVVDYKTVKEEDYIPVGVNYPCLGRPGTNDTHSANCFLAKHSEGHKWYWIDNQSPEEVLVLRFFDSDVEPSHGTAAGGVLHSSVEMAGTDDVEARESLEIRCMCIW